MWGDTPDTIINLENPFRIYSIDCAVDCEYILYVRYVFYPLIFIFQFEINIFILVNLYSIVKLYTLIDTTSNLVYKLVKYIIYILL